MKSENYTLHWLALGALLGGCFTYLVQVPQARQDGAWAVMRCVRGSLDNSTDPEQIVQNCVDGVNE